MHLADEEGAIEAPDDAVAVVSLCGEGRRNKVEGKIRAVVKSLRHISSWRHSLFSLTMHRPACHCHGHGIVHCLQVPAGNLAEQIGPLDGIAGVQQTLLQVLQSVAKGGRAKRMKAVELLKCRTSKYFVLHPNRRKLPQSAHPLKLFVL